MHLFHIYLHHGHIDLKLHLLWCISYLLEYVADHAWNHTPFGLVDEVRAEHRMCLTTRCLPIRKNSPVEALHDAKHNRFDSLLIDKALRRVDVENLIIVECVSSTIARRVCPRNLHCILPDEIEEIVSLPKNYHHRHRYIEAPFSIVN